jgi:hypothetical protein
MKIMAKTITRDNKIETQIKSFGVRALAARLGVSHTFIYLLINEKIVCPEKRYKQIKKILDSK